MGTLHLKPRASSQLRFKKTEWKQKQCWEAVNSGLSVMENLMNNKEIKLQGYKQFRREFIFILFLFIFFNFFFFLVLF